MNFLHRESISCRRMRIGVMHYLSVIINSTVNTVHSVADFETLCKNLRLITVYN